jgi:hypothetical protein
MRWQLAIVGGAICLLVACDRVTAPTSYDRPQGAARALISPGAPTVGQSMGPDSTAISLNLESCSGISINSGEIAPMDSLCVVLP